jgi:hypothetical protein
MNNVERAMREVIGFGVLVILLLAGCATLRHPGFTESAVLKLRTGMSADEVRAIFGNPDQSEVTTCGGSTPDPWQCMIWTYEMGDYDWNRIYFSVDADPPRLNNWTIEQMHPDPGR